MAGSSLKWLDPHLNGWIRLGTAGYGWVRLDPAGSGGYGWVLAGSVWIQVDPGWVWLGPGGSRWILGGS